MGHNQPSTITDKGDSPACSGGAHNGLDCQHRAISFPSIHASAKDSTKSRTTTNLVKDNFHNDWALIKTDFSRELASAKLFETIFWQEGLARIVEGQINVLDLFNRQHEEEAHDLPHQVQIAATPNVRQSGAALIFKLLGQLALDEIAMLRFHWLNICYANRWLHRRTTKTSESISGLDDELD